MYVRFACNLKYNATVIDFETNVKFETSPVCCNVGIATLCNANVYVLEVVSPMCVPVLCGAYALSLLIDHTSLFRA